MVFTKPTRALILGLVLAASGLAGCGRGQVLLPGAAQAKAGAKLAVRSTPAATALGRAAQTALAVLVEATAAYKAAGLDRGGARKLDPKGSAAVRQTALGVAKKLEQAAKAMEAELAQGDASEQALGLAWAAKAPLLASAPPPGEDAAAALYHVAQWRLKLSALIENAYRARALPAAGQPSDAESGQVVLAAVVLPAGPLESGPGTSRLEAP